MSLYIQDDNKKTVRHYCTTPKVEKAIETILAQIEGLSSSETHEGYKVGIEPIDTTIGGETFKKAESGEE